MPDGFSEADVENAIRDALTQMRGVKWTFTRANELNRRENFPLVERVLHDALVRLNPDIAREPENAEEVIRALRTMTLSAAQSGLTRANEEFTAWMRSEKSMPFGPNSEHVPVKLIDFDTLENNTFQVTQQYTFAPTPTLERRMDLVLLVNGIPLVVGEIKTPNRPSVSWADAAADFVDDYWVSVPGLFAPNVFCFASDGKKFRYATIASGYQNWAPWRDTEDRDEEDVSLEGVLKAVRRFLTPRIVLDMLRTFTIFPTTSTGRKIKVIARYQQYEAANRIVERVVQGQVKKGLIWHFQGSGKSFLMVFAAQLLKQHPDLKAPTVIIVVDRTDLDTQIGGTFNAAQVPNTVQAGTRKELEKLLRQDTRKTIITTLHKFGEADGVLNARDNIVLLVDEAHRTQEGDLGMKMRVALPNAFLFGLTGTPISRRDRNTFAWFGADEDPNRYLNYYSYRQSIQDEATLPVRFEPRMVELRMNRQAIDLGLEELARVHDLELVEKAEISSRAGRLGALLKAPRRLEAIAKDIAVHFQTRVQPQKLKGIVVMYDREAVVRMKLYLDELLGPAATECVMITQADDVKNWREQGIPVTDEDYARWQKLDQEPAELEKLLTRYKNPESPLQLLIVTSKLLTGFDAALCYAMYLDKPLRDHTLLQAICRTNRLSDRKTHGLVVDYYGVFEDIGKALDFDPKQVEAVITNLDQLRDQFPGAILAALAHFPADLDRSKLGYEGLLEAQQHLRTNAQRDVYAADYSVVSRLWEALSPDPGLAEYEIDYTWLTQVYESVRPSDSTGRLAWMALGQKTLQLIHQNIEVVAVRGDLDSLVLDAELVEQITEDERQQKSYELHATIAWRLRHRGNDSRFKALGERLEDLKLRYEQGLINSIQWLKDMLEVATNLRRVENENDVQIVDQAKPALTQLFLEYKIETMPAIVENVVNEIDQLVREKRFEDWQTTSRGERDMKKVLRQALKRFQLHKEDELFNRAFDYVKQYY
jgi:type I restriction enzyme, R subunit